MLANAFSYLKSLPVQLLVSILAAFLLGSRLDASQVTLFYTGSSCFIETLLFILPVMVFSFIFSSMATNQSQSLKLILFIFCAILCSNLIALYAAYFFSSLVLPTIGISYAPELFAKFSSPIKPLFKMNLPNLLSTDKAMLLAVAAGVVMNFLPKDNRVKGAIFSGVSFLSRVIAFFLHRIFIPLLPLYVFGFCLKLSFDQALPHLFQSYGKVFLLSMLLAVCYVLLLFFAGAGGRVRLAFEHIRKMAPAGLTGFSTMSSAATMPVTLECTQEVTQDRQLTDLIIPTTSNIHMLGDDLTIVVAAMALLTMFGMPTPDLMTFTLFAGAFCIAKLSCVGIPGASVLVVLPVLKNYLDFTPEMVTVLTTIYILQDCFGTCANVMGNGAFALIVQRLSKFSLKKRVAVSPDA